MKTEELKLNADYLLLGERRTSRALRRFVFLLRILTVALLVTGLVNAELLYRDARVLGAMYVITAILLRLLLWCAEVFRIRWLLCKANGIPVSSGSLFVDFSFADIICAVKLSLLVRLYCFFRVTLFLLLPACFLLTSYIYAKNGVSGAVLSVLICGNILLLLLASVFCAAALEPVLYAGRLSCFEKKTVLKCFRERIRLLDVNSFSLLGLRFFAGILSTARKEMAGLIYARSVVYSESIKNE